MDTRICYFFGFTVIAFSQHVRRPPLHRIAPLRERLLDKFYFCVESTMKMMMMKAFLLLLLPLASEAVRVKRVKAGMHYNKHDPVHVVVNKVG